MATRKYEQRLRAEAAEETRRRILDAIEARLHDAPAKPVSVDAIARDAGVARSTVYLIFGSRGELFDAFAMDQLERSGFARVVEATAHPDAREHLRGGLRGSAHAFAQHRDIARSLYSMAALDPAALGGAIERIETRRARGMARLAAHLDEQGLLRPGVSVEEAAHVLWLLAGFDAFDLLFAGRNLSADAVGDLLVAMAERSLLAAPD